MPITFFPSTVYHQLEKESRAFLWGYSNNNRRIHVVGWQEVCKPKSKGGFNLRYMKAMKTTFLMKVG